MNTVAKYTIVTPPLMVSTWENIAVFSSEFTRKLESLGVEAPIIKICADVPTTGNKEFDETRKAEVKDQLTHWSANGFEYNGNTYVPFMAGSSDIRKAVSTWMRKDITPIMGKWCLCGLESKNIKLAINKYMAYLGLLSSASKPFVEVFGRTIDIRRVAIIPDGSVTVKSVVDLVNGNVTHSVDRSCEINAFDGFGIIRSALTNGESCTLRGPWIKAFVQSVNFKDIAAFAYEHGIKPEFKDFWGNTVRLADVDIILTESCFKAAKLYESWTQYQDAFEQMGHTICVCVQEHKPRLKGMPYQQGQTLMGTEDDALHFMQHAKSTVFKYHDPQEAAKLLRGEHRLAARMYPALLNEKHTKRSIQEKYASKKMDMLGGRIPELGYNAFLAPDLIAFTEHLFGLPVKGFLKPGECCCHAAKEGPVDVTRNPHLDNAHCVLMNNMNMPFAKGPTMFINIFDMVTIRLRCDYDGDHVWWSQDEYLLNLVNRTFEQLKNIPIDWDVGKADKVKITRSAICSFITNLIHSSEIGLYADALTKMWNSKYDREVCDWLTYAGNVLIDAAKHASAKIVKPKAVRDLDNISLPMFAMYAKANDRRPIGPFWTDERYICENTKDEVIYASEYDEKKHGTIKKVKIPRCRQSNSFLDLYSKAVDENIPNELTINGVEDLIFDPHMLKIKDGRKVIPGMFKKGTINFETKTYEGSGLFNQIAFRHSDEWKALMNTADAKMHRDEWEAACKHEALQEIVYYVRSLYADHDLTRVSDDSILDAAYDSVVSIMFATDMTDGADTVVKQCFWRIFGDRAVKALQANGCFIERAEDLFDEEFDGFDDDNDLFAAD